MRLGRKVVVIGLNAPPRAPEEELHERAEEVAFEHGRLRLRAEGGRRRQRSTHVVPVGTARTDRLQRAGRHAHEPVETCRGIEILVRRKHPELVIEIALLERHHGSRIRERGPHERAGIVRRDDRKRGVPDDRRARIERVRDGLVNVLPLGLAIETQFRKEREIVEPDARMVAVAVDVEVAAIAGGLVVGKPRGKDVLGRSGVSRRAGLRRFRRAAQELEQRRVETAVEVPREILPAQDELRAHREAGRPQDHRAGRWQIRRLAGLLDDRLETRRRRNALEIVVGLNDLGVPEARFDGLFERVKRGIRRGTVGKRAGEVVLPCRIAGHELETLPADGLHVGDVSRAHRLHKLRAQQGMGHVEARIVIEADGLGLGCA